MPAAQFDLYICTPPHPPLLHPTCLPLVQVEFTLKPYQYLVPPHLSNSKPSYFLCGGLVFTACSGAALGLSLGRLLAHCRLAAAAVVPPLRADTWACVFADPYLVQRYGSLSASPGERACHCCPAAPPTGGKLLQ